MLKPEKRRYSCFFKLCLHFCSVNVVVILFCLKQVRILRSLFPPLLLDLYKLLISPLGNGKVAAIMVGKWRPYSQFIRGTELLSSLQF